MELQLHRLDLLQTGAASPGTLLVLPPGENKMQKVAVGDMSGVIQCFSVKKGEVVVSFRSLPGPQKVTAMALGRSAKLRDKIFVAAGNTVRGVTKKGKEFFRFTGGLTESITHLDVAESHIWASCQQVLNHYMDGQDHGLYMAPDTITATDLLPLPGVGDWLPVIASKDCCIRVMGTDGKPVYEIPTASAPTALRHVSEPHGGPGARHAKAKELLYGCQDGRVVQLLVDAGAVRQGFTITGAAGSREDMKAPVTAIHCGADYSKTGCADIVIGREDGSLEVWDIDPQGAPQLVVSTALPESITAVDGGYITNAGSPDIIVHTFTGKVIAFASHPAAMVMAAAEAASARGLKSLSSFNSRANQQDLLAALNARIAKETAELAELKAKVAKERERLAASGTSGAAAITHTTVVDVKHRLSLQDGAFLLYVEAAVPLFALALKSAVPLKLMDMPGHMAIHSLSPPGPADGNATLATYRFQESTNRLTIKFTAAEGTPGKVTVYIIPATGPKTCRAIEVLLLPLCLHQLVSNPSSVLKQQGLGAGLQGDEGAAVLFDQLQLERPLSELVLQGGFSGQDIHSWLTSVLPGLPQHMPSSSSSSCHQLFKQQETGTLLACVYGPGQATFLCESLTTMAILHDALLAAATSARQRVSMRFKVHPASLAHCCGLLWPRFEVQRRMARRRKLAAALQELQVQEGGDLSFLAPDYQALLADVQPPAAGGASSDQQAAATAAGGAAASTHADDGLDAAVDSIKRLFLDYCRFSTGATAAVQRHIPALDKLLRAEAASVCSLQSAVDFMSRAL